MSIIAGGLALITSFFKKGDKGGLIKGILGVFGKIKCLGGTAYPQSQYDQDVAYMETTMGYMANYPESIPDLQRDYNTIHAFWQTNKNNVGNMSNACTKQRMNDFINVCANLLAQCDEFFEYSGTVTYERWGVNFQVPRIVRLKITPTVSTPPTNPTSPPINTPTGGLPEYTTNPPIYTPPTPPATPVPSIPPKVVNIGGVSTTYVPNTDGTTTVSTYDGNTGQTSQISVPSSSLDVNLGGSVGDWSFGASNTQNKNLPLILGGVGVLAFLIFKNKK